MPFSPKIDRVSNWMSTAVAKADNLPNQGSIAIGYDADLGLVDVQNYQPIDRQDIVSKCGWSLFEGWHLTGYPVYPIVNGNIVYEQGTIRSLGILVESTIIKVDRSKYTPTNHPNVCYRTPNC